MLFQISYDGAALTAKPAYEGMSNIAKQSTGQDDKTALVVRILPVLEEGPRAFTSLNAMEVYGLFDFRTRLPSAAMRTPPRSIRQQA